MECLDFGVIKAKTGHYLMKIVQTLRGDWMSEKRFVYGVIKGTRQAHIMDCHTCKSITIDVYDDDFKYFVDRLNELYEENKKLKYINDQLEERLESSGIGVALKTDR